MAVKRSHKRGRRAGAVHLQPHSKTFGQRWHGYMRAIATGVNLRTQEAAQQLATKKAEAVLPWECTRCGALWGPFQTSCKICGPLIEIATEADYRQFMEEHERGPKHCAHGDCGAVPDDEDDFCAFHDELNERSDHVDPRAWTPFHDIGGASKWDGFGRTQLTPTFPTVALPRRGSLLATANRRRVRQRRTDREKRRLDHQSDKLVQVKIRGIREAQRELRRLVTSEKRWKREVRRILTSEERRIQVLAREAWHRDRVERAAQREIELQSRRVERAQALHARSKWGSLVDTLAIRGETVLIPTDDLTTEANRLRAFLCTCRRTCKWHWSVRTANAQIAVKRGGPWLDPTVDASATACGLTLTLAPA